MWKLKNNVRFISQTGMKLLKTWMIMLTSTGLEEALQTISKLQPKRVWVTVFFKHDLMKNAQNIDQRKQAKLQWL